jgi:hypothetical protein
MLIPSFWSAGVGRAVGGSSLAARGDRILESRSPSPSVSDRSVGATERKGTAIVPVMVTRQVDPRLLKSRRRSHNALVPRQIAMYLTRRLTPLSLEQIGAYFGGRDHSTVLHACRKVERGRDAVLSGVVRQLQADLA